MKKFFAKGLIALLPIVLTIMVVYFIISFIGNPLGEALRWIVSRMGLLPQEELEKSPFKELAPVIGFIVGVILIFFSGFLVANFLGKKIYQILERLVSRLPVIRTIYPYARQFTDFLFSSDEKKLAFKHAVAIPFPAPGVYSIGLVTGNGMKSLNDATRKHLICIFVPTAPTPFTGYVVYVPREDVIPLSITVEEAMRIIISAGVLHPNHELVMSDDIPGGAGPRKT